MGSREDSKEDAWGSGPSAGTGRWKHKGQCDRVSSLTEATVQAWQ